MSDYESHSGKIKFVEKQGNESFEAQCKRIWVELGESEDNYDEGDLFGKFYDKYFYHKDQLWEIIEHQDLEDQDSFCILQKEDDNVFSFTTRFYNGGTYLTEMLEDQVKRLK